MPLGSWLQECEVDTGIPLESGHSRRQRAEKVRSQVLQVEQALGPITAELAGPAARSPAGTLTVQQ